MSDESFPEAPPEEIPDEGMSTAHEEWAEKSETAPNINDDFGMSAGYPIIKDETIPHDPGEPPDEMKIPPEKAMQGAPIFSETAFELPNSTIQTAINSPDPGPQESHESGA